MDKHTRQLEVWVLSVPRARVSRAMRHGFGVNAFQSNVPPHLVQRWLGHASLRTTAIYADVIGPDERAFAARMWADRIIGR